MPGSQIIDGHARRTLFAAAPGALVGSTGLGVYKTDKHSRFTGLFSIVGSATLQWRYGVSSGQYQVTSSVVINSGAVVFDQLSYGRYVEFGFNSVNSQTPSYFIAGEPLR
jgi:hypothetical protein